MNRLSTSTPRPVTARGQRTRRALVEAAELVFGERGYEGASISDITRAAGVALGTFYVYFPDKKALFVEVVENLGERLRHALRRAIGGAPSRVEVERRGLEAFFAFAREHRLLYRVVRQAEFVDEAVFRRYYARIAEPYAEGLAAAMRAGEVRDGDPEALAFCLMGMADFLGMRYVLWGRGRGLDAALETAAGFIAGGFGPRRASGAARAERKAPTADAAPARRPSAARVAGRRRR